MDIPVLDQDHRALFGLINDLYELASGGASVAAVREKFEEVVVHARLHFTREEDMMERSGFPRLAWHRQDHEKIMGRFVAFCREHLLGEAPDGLPATTGEFFRHWVIQHIEEEDFCYRSYLKWTKGLG